MIDKSEQDTRPKTQDAHSTSSGQARPKQGRILRAKDIIPGAERTAGSDEESGAKEFDIPRFNLANDIMSAQRRQSVIRRKGPESAEDRRPGFAQGATPGKQRTEDRGQRTEDKFRIADFGLQILREDRTQNTEQRIKKTEWKIETLRDSIIAEIVARDIERLCSGH